MSEDTGEEIIANEELLEIEEVEPDEVSGVDADESETRGVVIDKKLIIEAGDEPVRDPDAEPKEDNDGSS